MLELLVHPYRDNDQERVDGFYALLSTFPNLSWVPATLDIADQAARFRAEHNLKTPDAIQGATAVFSSATGLVSNDPAFLRIKELDVLVFDALLDSVKQ